MVLVDGVFNDTNGKLPLADFQMLWSIELLFYMLHSSNIYVVLIFLCISRTNTDGLISLIFLLSPLPGEGVQQQTLGVFHLPTPLPRASTIAKPSPKRRSQVSIAREFMKDSG